MLETQHGPIFSEWRNTPLGLERTGTGKFGETITETRLPFPSQISSRTASFILEKRDWGEIRNGSKVMQDQYVTLGNPGDFSLTRISFVQEEKEGKSIDVFLEKDGGSRVPDYSGALVSLKYDGNTGKLLECDLQAERGASIIDSIGKAVPENEDAVVGVDVGMYQQLLRIASFDRDKFSWQEIERNDTPDSGPDIDKLVREETSAYGQRASIQDNTFLIAKAGDVILVTCYSSQRKEKWSAKFSLKVDMSKIMEIFNDLDSDFRLLRSLLSAELKVN